MAESKPPEIKWSREQAAREGWDIFVTSRGTVELQRDDEVAAAQAEGGVEVTFTTDAQVAAFVLNSAMEGSEYHRDALALVLGAATCRGVTHD